MDQAPRISRDSPLRLDVAVKEAFPAGGITVAGLRKEIAKGRLEVEMIAGKLFTTLAAIDRMRERCKVKPPRRSSTDTIDQQRILSDRSTFASQDRLQEAVRLTLEKLEAEGPTRDGRRGNKNRT